MAQDFTRDFSQIRTKFDKWETKIDQLNTIFKDVVNQHQEYHEKLSTPDYYKNTFVPQFLKTIGKQDEFSFILDGQKFKKIIKQKYKIINQLYFQKDKETNKQLKFNHARLNNFLSLLNGSQSKSIQTPLRVKHIQKIIQNNICKNITKQFIALLSYLQQCQNRSNQKTININSLRDQKVQIKLKYQPLFAPDELKSFLNTKGFSSAVCEKLYKQVQDYSQYKNYKEGKDYKQLMKKYDYDNSQVCFKLLACTMQLEIVMDNLKSKGSQNYLRDWALIENSTICRGLVFGALDGLKRQKGKDEDEDQQDKIYQYFLQFFQGVFDDQNLQKTQIKSICRGILQVRKESQNKKQYRKIIQQQWFKD